MTNGSTLPDALTEVAADDRFAAIIERVVAGHEQVLLTRDGAPLAAIVSVEDAATLEALEDAKDGAEIRAWLDEWRRDVAAGEAASIPFAEVARRHGLSIGKAGE